MNDLNFLPSHRAEWERNASTDRSLWSRLTSIMDRILPNRKSGLHCWTPGPTTYHYFDEPHEDPGTGRLVYPGVREVSRTCMLPDGHEGPHEWTPDHEITVKFR